jgi:hypothetical protein
VIGCWRGSLAGGEDLQLPPHTAVFVHFLAATTDQHPDVDVMRAQPGAVSG